MSRNFRLLASGAALALLASCGANGSFDPDLRGLMNGRLTTADAAARATPRPQPDSRGVITYANHQVAIARQGDTPATIAARLGLNAEQLARHNALPVGGALHAGAVVALPARVAAGAPAAGGLGALIRDPFANAQTTAAQPAPAAPAREHQVAAGETAWSIARRYGVSVQDLAAWNGLPSNMALRVGQRLTIPAAGQRPPASASTTAPGQGSPTPRPPSASEALPREQTTAAATPAPSVPTPDLGATRTAASGSGRFQMPASGSIIRLYEKGKNDGIDIASAAGSPVKAAGGGTVAAITRDTAGVPIVVVRHDGDLMTVYTGIENLQVAKGDSVSGGQSIGSTSNAGVVHFEVRRGFDSVNPEDYLN